jgi:LysM repeat protein
VVTRVAEATTVSRLLETATPLPRPHVYAVRPGDNLSSIASGFGVSLVELQRVNNIDDPNLLRVGQELIIPLDGPLRITPQLPRPATPEGGTAPPLPTSVEWIPTGTPTAAVTKTATPSRTPLPEKPNPTTIPPLNSPTPGPVVPTGPADVGIEGAVGTGQIEAEGLVLVNAGGEDADLSGWVLLIKGELNYEFADGTTITPGGRVTLFTRQGEDTDTDLFWGLEAPLWEGVESPATLYDAQGNVVDRYAP